jgi:flagellar hook-associated protein 1
VSIFSVLNIAKGALSAAQTSVQVTSNNIANVNTAGYARQQVVQAESTPTPTDLGLLGNGVTVQTVRRYYDKFLESSIRSKTSNSEEQSVLSTYLNRVQGFLNEDNSNLSGNITAFFNDWQSLSTDPTNSSLKQTIVSQGQTLSQSINTIYTDLKGIQTETDSQIVSDIDSINGTLSSIAKLNQLIVEAGGGDKANSYLDQKTQLLDVLSKKMDITTFDDEYGRTTILTKGGKPLVENGSAWRLTTIADATTGFSNVAWTDQSGTVTDITDSIGGGELKALIDTRDKYAPEFLNAMDNLSTALKGNVKWSVNGVTTSFFQGTSGGNLAVADSLVGDPTLISSTSDPVNNPTDNDIALAMASLADKNLCGPLQLVHASGSDALSDAFSSESAVVGTILSPPSAEYGNVTIKGNTYAIDFRADSLDDIRDAINNNPPPGVTASVITSVENGKTVHRLQLTNVTASDLTDQNNILQTLGVVEGTSTLVEYTATTVSTAGQVTADAENAAQYAADTLDTLSAQRASVSGVSIDEEMANLIKYQYAYQAASRLFNVADTLLQDLLGVVK